VGLVGFAAPLCQTSEVNMGAPAKPAKLKLLTGHRLGVDAGGGVLSSDDFGSSVERPGGRHALWRCLESDRLLLRIVGQGAWVE
jgi:hypothetical protein